MRNTSQCIFLGILFHYLPFWGSYFGYVKRYERNFYYFCKPFVLCWFLKAFKMSMDDYRRHTPTHIFFILNFTHGIILYALSFISLKPYAPNLLNSALFGNFNKSSTYFLAGPTIIKNYTLILSFILKYFSAKFEY